MKALSNELVKLIDEAIDHELVISELYMHFHQTFTQDRDFWWKIALEEKNHASILINIKALSETVNRLPKSLIPDNPALYQMEKDKILAAISNIDKNLTRELAFQMAYDTEISSVEEHYRLFVENQSDPNVFKIFQQLSNQDNDHASRILEYALVNGIRIRHK